MFFLLAFILCVRALLVQVLQYAPNAPNSRGGTKLLCQSDFFLGSRVAKVMGLWLLFVGTVSSKIAPTGLRFLFY